MARLQELFEAVIHSEDEKNLAYFPADDNDLPQRVEVINVEWLGVCLDAAEARHGDTLGEELYTEHSSTSPPNRDVSPCDVRMERMTFIS